MQDNNPAPFKLLQWRKRVEPFIRVTEIWVPSVTGATLEFGGGLYGDLTEFRSISETSRFSFNEGLPGKAWAARHPVVLKTFKESYFQRTDAAEKAGLTCGIAMPVFAGEALKAVVVFLCGSDERHVGAIEVWATSPHFEDQIGLDDGYYGGAELFEWTSRHTKFGRGNGLPGRVWSSAHPVIMNDLYSPGQFLRWEEAKHVGLNTGLGIPVPYDPTRTWVMTFLSALGTPIARRFEIWKPDENGDGMAFSAGYCAKNRQLAFDYEFAGFDKGEGLLGRVWETCTPAVTQDFAGELALQAKSISDAGLTAAIAMPILAPDGRPTSIVAWYF